MQHERQSLGGAEPQYHEQREARPSRPAALRARLGPVVAADDRVGHADVQRLLAPLRRERSTSRHTRATTVVSQRAVLDFARVRSAQPQPALLDRVVGLAQRAEHLLVGHRSQVGAVSSNCEPAKGKSGSSIGHIPSSPGVNEVTHEIELRRRVRAVLESLDSTIDPRELVRNLRLAEWKLIEIARALMTRPTFVVLDEPTALLDRHDSQTILALVEGLRAAGVGVAFVTHRLDESLRVGDVATVLRDGRRVATLPTEGLTQQRLVELIVGEKGWAAEAETPDRREGRPVVELSGVRAIPTAGRSISSRPRAGFSG